RQTASELGIPKAYGSYEELLADREIDAVYNPLPNHLHVPWSIRALESGKHVLCEKPIALSVAQAESLVAAGRRHPRLKLMEAFMYRHHPQWITARELVTNGGIGELRSIETIFCYNRDDPNDVRNRREWGGGALMDIGCYPISLSRWLFNAEPRRVVGMLEDDSRYGVDRLASAIMEFDRGTSTFTCSSKLEPCQRVNLLGTSGRVEIEIPFNAPPDRPTRIRHQHEETTDEIVFKVCDQYTIQGDLFSRAVLDDTPVPTPIDDAVANMRVIEAVFESAREGGWVRVAD
ncbi:MAG: Gfo/Idh/MocA family protein, partial [Planctomycetaceae bacterium]